VKIDSEKTKLLRLNSTNNEKVQVDEQVINDVESLVYLSTHIGRLGGAEEDIQARPEKVRAAYKKLSRIMNNQYYQFKLQQNQDRNFNSNVNLRAVAWM